MFHYKRRIPVGKDFRKKRMDRGMNEGWKDATGIGHAIALALPQQRRSFSVFSLTQLPSTLDRTPPHPFPLPRPSVSHPSLPDPSRDLREALPPPLPQFFLHPLAPSFFLAPFIRAQHRCRHRHRHRHRYHVVLCRYMYAAHPCPLLLPPPPPSVTQRACLPDC